MPTFNTTASSTPTKNQPIRSPQSFGITGDITDITDITTQINKLMKEKTKVPKVSAPNITPTQIAETEFPDYLDLREIREGLRTGSEMRERQSLADTNALFSRMGLTDSTMQQAEQRRVGDEALLREAQIDQGLYGLGLQHAGLDQARNLAQAEVDYRTKFQNAANQLQAGIFNSQAVLDAAKFDIEKSLRAAGLNFDQIWNLIQFQIQEESALQEALSQFIGEYMSM